MPPKQVLDGGLAWNFHVPRHPLSAVPTAGVAGWIAATPPGVLPVSVLTMGEIGQGIARIRGRGSASRANATTPAGRC